MTRSRREARAWGARVTAGLVLLLAFCGREGSAQGAPRTWVLRGVTVVDVVRGDTLPGAEIVVRSDRIACVARVAACEVPSAAEILERDGYVIPGLWNSHAHLTIPITYLYLPTRLDVEEKAKLRAKMLSIYLASGVTGLVSLIDDPTVLAPLTAAEASGDLTSPRIFSCGAGISYPGSWNADGAAATPTTVAAAREAVENLAAAGVDCIKITVERGPGPVRDNPRMPDAIVHAIVAEAHRFGLPVYAHATHPEEGLAVVDAGADVLAHSLDVVDAVPDSLRTAVAARRPYFSPTLTLKESMFRFVQHPEALDLPFLRSRLTPEMYRALVDSTTGARFIAFLSDLTARDGETWARENFARSLQTTRELIEAGAIALVGTDPVWYVVPGYDVHREMELMVDAGVEPLEVLRGATIHAAKALRRDADYGSVDAGKRADLVVLRANPLTDITHTRRIDLVIKAGRPFDPEALLADVGAGN